MRVIAGIHRGRKLAPVPKGVRPTSDRVRESIFARLPPLQGCRVLDLCCGTGALGIEAISRGAESVVFVDRAGASLAALARNLETLGIRSARSLRAEVGAAVARLAREGACFDLVFLDPPYASGVGTRALEALAEAGILAPEALVVVEGPKRNPLQPPGAFAIEDERDYGDTRVTRLRPGAEMRSGPPRPGETSAQAAGGTEA